MKNFVFFTIGCTFLAVSCNDSAFNGSGNEKTGKSDNAQGLKDDSNNIIPPQFKELIDSNQNIEDKFKEIVDQCKTNSKKTHKQSLTFKQEPFGCWGIDGSIRSEFIGEKIDAKFMAMVEQKQELNIPANSLLCDIKAEVLNSDGVSSESQEMYFDDEIYINFNGIMLAASSDKHLNSFDKEGGFLKWDWNKLKEKEYNTAIESNLYCAGEGTGSCTIPKTQTNGKIQISFKDITIKGISAITSQKVPKAYFSFITTGDNDSFDCKHSPFTMQVEVSYIGK